MLLHGDGVDGRGLVGVLVDHGAAAVGQSVPFEDFVLVFGEEGPLGHVDLTFFVLADFREIGKGDADAVVRVLGEIRLRVVGEFLRFVGLGVDGGFGLRLDRLDLRFHGVRRLVGRHRDRFRFLGGDGHAKCRGRESESESFEFGEH